MLTRCPSCDAWFRVRAEHLSVANGYVTCGACENVFNALNTLVEEGGQPPVLTAREKAPAVQVAPVSAPPPAPAARPAAEEPSPPGDDATADSEAQSERERPPPPATSTATEASTVAYSESRQDPAPPEPLPPAAAQPGREMAPPPLPAPESEGAPETFAALSYPLTAQAPAPLNPDRSNTGLSDQSPEALSPTPSPALTDEPAAEAMAPTDAATTDMPAEAEGGAAAAMARSAPTTASAPAVEVTVSQAATSPLAEPEANPPAVPFGAAPDNEPTNTPGEGPRVAAPETPPSDEPDLTPARPGDAELEARHDSSTAAPPLASNSAIPSAQTAGPASGSFAQAPPDSAAVTSDAAVEAERESVPAASATDEAAGEGEVESAVSADTGLDTDARLADFDDESAPSVTPPPSADAGSPAVASAAPARPTSQLSAEAHAVLFEAPSSGDAFEPSGDDDSPAATAIQSAEDGPEAAAAANDDNGVPDVLREEYAALEQASQPRSRRTLWWSLAAVFLVVAIGVQLALVNRAQVEAQIPQTAPWFERLCRHLSCVSIKPTDGPQQIRLTARDIREHPRYAEALLVNATLVNEGPAAVPFPALQLMLHDATGTTLGARRFAPHEYLDDSISIDAGMAPGQPVYVVMELGGAANAAVSFEFSFL